MHIDYRGVCGGCGDNGFRPEPEVRMDRKVGLSGEGEEVLEREPRALSVAMLEPQSCRTDHGPTSASLADYYDEVTDSATD